MPRVFVTGAAGFVGMAVVRELLRRDHTVEALVHRRPIDLDHPNLRCTPGGLFDDDALNAGLASCEAVIHLVGIIEERPGQQVTFERIHVEGTQRVVNGALRHGARRYVQMSALGVREGARSRYHQTKWRAEEIVRGSALDWTILRPSMIHGPRGDFMRMEVEWARGKAAPYLFMPYFGAGLLGTGGSGTLQPVHVDDVARGFAESLERVETIGKTIPVVGEQAMTWPELHRAASQAIRGRPKAAIPIPAWYASLLTRLLPARLLPFNRDQVTMSQEDNMGDIAEFESAFGWRPGGFEEMLQGYAAEL